MSVPSGGTTIVQVLDGAGRVAAASPGGDRLVPLLEPGELARARDGAAVELSGRRLGVSEVLRAVGVRAGPDGAQTVLVAGPVADIQRSVVVVEKAMVVVCLVLVAGAALLSRWLVGSALRPVETLTRDAAALGTRGGAGTLPLPAADDEIRRLAVTLNGMLARLDAAAKRQRAFVADAAHELRSPLASIRTAVEVSRLPGAQAGDGADGGDDMAGHGRRRARGHRQDEPARRRPVAPRPARRRPRGPGRGDRHGRPRRRRRPRGGTARAAARPFGPGHPGGLRNDPPCGRARTCSSASSSTSWRTPSGTRAAGWR